MARRAAPHPVVVVRWRTPDGAGMSGAMARREKCQEEVIVGYLLSR